MCKCAPCAPSSIAPDQAYKYANQIVSVCTPLYNACDCISWLVFPLWSEGSYSQPHTEMVGTMYLGIEYVTLNILTHNYT